MSFHIVPNPGCFVLRFLKNILHFIWCFHFFYFVFNAWESSVSYTLFIPWVYVCFFIVFIPSNNLVGIFKNNSISLLNSTFKSWNVFIILFHCCLCFLQTSLRVSPILFKVLEHIPNCWFEVCILCFRYILFIRAYCYCVTGFWWSYCLHLWW